MIEKLNKLQVLKIVKDSGFRRGSCLHRASSCLTSIPRELDATRLYDVHICTVSTPLLCPLPTPLRTTLSPSCRLLVGLEFSLL